MESTTKTEISAGGIVARKTAGGWDVLVLQDRNDAWTFPKGKVEKDETAENAAKREIAEEVGIHNLTFIAPLPIVHYMYTRDGLVSKTVYYFVFISQGLEPLVNQTEEGIHEAQWMPLEQAIDVIGYKKTNEPLLTETQRILLQTS